MENCCDVFPKFIGKFEWLSITEEKDVTFVLPHLKIDGSMWKINYCPSCGKEIIGYSISYEDYLSITL